MLVIVSFGELRHPLCPPLKNNDENDVTTAEKKCHDHRIVRQHSALMMDFSSVLFEREIPRKNTTWQTYEFLRVIISDLTDKIYRILQNSGHTQLISAIAKLQNGATFILIAT